MSTKSKFSPEEMVKSNPVFSQVRATIETAFYGNNVKKLNSIRDAYKLACKTPGTIITDMPVYKAQEQGLAEDTKVLLFNDGTVTGRTAIARRIVGEEGVDVAEYAGILREAIYNTRLLNLNHSQAYIGLHEDFMVKANLLLPEGFENLNYNWMLNFQYITDTYAKMYDNSKKYDDNGDIFIFADPNWKHDDFPYGLCFFDPVHNCAAILGMRYFGEFKKGTLTLAWAMANRNDYVACHAGQKRYTLDNGDNFVSAVFGLSGSGKSTITHAKHDGKYEVSVLHDDAFIISSKDGSSVALEPTYFDKTQDYPTASSDNKFLLTVQNNAATIDDKGRVLILTEDIRNGNGRAIKSKLWAENRLDKFPNPVNAIIWLMKDNTLPPVIKINNPILASSIGATLATKRTTAERLAKGVDMNQLVIEPYANPFRVYQLENDYLKFKALFKERDVDCYILNTGDFMEKKITKETTLEIMEKIVEKKANFKKWHNFDDIEIMEIGGFVPNMEDKEYTKLFKERFKNRVDYINSLKTEKGGFNKLPDEAAESLNKIISKL